MVPKTVKVYNNISTLLHNTARFYRAFSLYAKRENWPGYCSMSKNEADERWSLADCIDCHISSKGGIAYVPELPAFSTEISSAVDTLMQGLSKDKNILDNIQQGLMFAGTNDPGEVPFISELQKKMTYEVREVEMVVKRLQSDKITAYDVEDWLMMKYGEG